MASLVLAPKKKVVGLWLNKDTYRVTHLATNRTINYTIQGTELLEKNELQEWVLYCEEDAAKELSQEAAPKLTKGQQHDLGGVLLDIRDSKRYKRENLHGRYW